MIGRRGFIGGLLALAAAPFARAETKTYRFRMTYKSDRLNWPPVRMFVSVNGQPVREVVLRGGTIPELIDDANVVFDHPRAISAWYPDSPYYLPAFSISRATYPKLKPAAYHNALRTARVQTAKGSR